MGGGFGDWIIGVYLRFATNGPVTMARLSSSMDVANAGLLQQQGLIDANTAAMLRYQRQIEAVRMQQLRLGTRIAGDIALGGIVLSVAGLDQAAQLQKAMAAVGIATNTPDEHMQRYYDMTVRMSNITAQSVATIGREMAVAAASGLKSQSQLLSAFPLIAKAADVLWLSPQHVDPVNAVKLLTQLTHLFGAYQGPAFTHMMNRAAQLMFAQPERFQQMVTQGKYFIPMAMEAGVGEDDIFRIMMAMGQTGLGRGRGGAGIRRMIQYLLGAATLTGHLSAAQHLAMGVGLPGRPGLNILGPDGRLKGEFEDKKGNLLLGKVLAYLERERGRFRPADFANDLVNAFLQQGGLVAGTLLLPQVYRQSQLNWSILVHQANIEGMWKRYSQTLSFAVPQFVTNFKNVLAAIFLPTLPTVTRWLKDAAQEMGVFTSYLMKNQGAAAAWAKGIALVTAWGAARWAIGVAMLSRNLFGLMGSINVLASDVNLATGRILASSALLGVGAVGAGGGAVRGATVVGEDALKVGGLAGLMIGVGKFLDNLITGGLGQAIVRGATRFTFWATEKWLLPGLAFASKFGAAGSKFAQYVSTFALASDDAVTAIATLAGGVAFALGRLNPVLFGLQAGWTLAGGMGTTESQAQDDRARQLRLQHLIRRFGRNRVLEMGVHNLATGRYETGNSPPHTVHIHGGVHFNLPRGTAREQGRAAFQHFLNLTGAIGTTPYVPSAITVSGAAFGAR